MSGHNIECPWCKANHTVFHMEWSGMGCTECREYIPNPSKVLLNVEGGQILSMQSGSENFSDNYWVVIPNGTSSSLGFHSWGNGMRMSNAYTLEYDDLSNLYDAIGMALEECGHAVSRKDRGDKDSPRLSDKH